MNFSLAEEAQAALPTLRLLTCGSVDDGKSTLIGRLLYQEKLIFDDQLAALERDSKKFGTIEDDIDFALLVDGLEAEREQGITIDVAYRYFATAKRSFIVADTPGHEQYTRNMATGASNADLAIVLVDARKGLLTQTHRHSIIVSLLGVRHVVLAVNKIDLVDFSETVFRQIEADYRTFAESLGFRSLMAMPISARYGDNVSSRSERMPWYRGPHLLEYLETVEVEDNRRSAPFRLPVQWINRPHLDFRGFSGTIPSGRIARGDAIVVAGSGRQSTVKRIFVADREVETAHAGDAVTLTLADEIDIARGDLLSKPDSRPEVADQFTAHILWMSAKPMLPGRSYLLKIGGRTTPASVTELKHRLDVNNFDKLAAKHLDLNEVGLCNIATTMPVAYDAYAENRETGAFILIDRLTNETAAAGMIAHGLQAGDQRALARHGGHSRDSRRAQASEACNPVVHRVVGLGEIDHRQPRRGQASRARRAHHASRRRQRPPRPQQGLRLHRRGSGREHPARRRGGETDDRRRAHRAVLFHLAVRGGAAAGPHHGGGRGVSRDLCRGAARHRHRARSERSL